MTTFRKSALLAFVLAISSLAWADQITFSFISLKNAQTVDARSGGLHAGPALNFLITDATTGVSFPLKALVSITTGGAASFTVLSSPNLVLATYDANTSGDSVLVTNFITGKPILTGNINDHAALVARYPSDTGAFTSTFDLLFVDASVLAPFGLGPSPLSPIGSAGFTFGQTNLVGGTDLQGVIGGGSITIQASPVPEPSTLGLTGTSLLMVVGFVRRRIYK